MSSDKNNSKTEKYCPISAATKIVGDFWNILIIRELIQDEKRRFGELERQIDSISSTMLSNRLKSLTEAGIISRKQYSSIPPKVEYSLTEKGRDLEEIVTEIENYAEKHYKK
jgi:DNA-binding HxlR family transcriptional regulator